MTAEKTHKLPYLCRALHEWMTDNGQTPHLVVDASVENTVVPAEFVKDERIVLNVSYAATRDLNIGNDEVTFTARFSGRPFGVSIPVMAVLAIYARETGEGMLFSDVAREHEDVTAGGESAKNAAAPASDPDGPTRSHLRIIK